MWHSHFEVSSARRRLVCMKKLIWQNDNWLTIPEIDEEDKNILNDIDCLDKKISEFKNFDFFYDVKKNTFVHELFYNWYSVNEISILLYRYLKDVKNDLKEIKQHGLTYRYLFLN